MNLPQFKDWAIKQGSVAKTDGGYPGECVSLLNQYLAKVFGIQAGAWGHAKDWATSANVLSHFDKVSGTPQAGDIIVYDGRFGGGYGHIAIALGNNQMLDQNGAGNGRIRTGSVWPNYSAILRRKGSSTSQGGNMTPEQIAEIRRVQLDDMTRLAQDRLTEIESLKRSLAEVINIAETRRVQLESGEGAGAYKELKARVDKAKEILG